MEQLRTTQLVGTERKPLGLVWIDCPYPVVAAGLKSALEGKARVHLGTAPPADDVPSSAIFDTGSVEGCCTRAQRELGALISV